MKVKDLEALIQRHKDNIWEEFLDYTVCIECFDPVDLENKRKDNASAIHRCSDDWELIEVENDGDMVNCKSKIFGIGANS